MKDYSNSKIPRLFELMEERNIKAKDITVATGISAASFTDWGKKGSVPSPQKLQLLSEFFDVPVEYLLGTDSDEDSEDKKLLIEIKRLDESQKQHLLTYIKFMQSQNQLNGKTLKDYITTDDSIVKNNPPESSLDEIREELKQIKEKLLKYKE